MTNTWFTSDHHFGHKNILEFESVARPFATLDEMHEVLIDRWNSVVKPSDKVYHLGDFCFGKHNLRFAGLLNGKKYLVLGNHDTYGTSGDYLQYFDRLFGVTFWHKCILSHVPVHPNNLVSRSVLNVHGHLHSKQVQTKFFPEYLKNGFEADPAYFNVSVECNNLTPVHADIILERMNSL